MVIHHDDSKMMQYYVPLTLPDHLGDETEDNDEDEEWWTALSYGQFLICQFETFEGQI